MVRTHYKLALLCGEGRLADKTQGETRCPRCSCPCGNRALKCSCPDCPYVSKTSKVKENEKHKQETVLETRERLQATYDSHVDKEGVRAAIRLHPPYEDARAEGVYDFAEQSMEFCHVLPADTVNKIIAWGHNLDPKYAVLTITSEIIGIIYLFLA